MKVVTHYEKKYENSSEIFVTWFKSVNLKIHARWNIFAIYSYTANS